MKGALFAFIIDEKCPRGKMLLMPQSVVDKAVEMQNDNKLNENLEFTSDEAATEFREFLEPIAKQCVEW